MPVTDKPSDEAILAAAPAHSTRLSLATAFDMADSTFKRHLARRDLTERVREMMTKAAPEAKPVDDEDELRAVALEDEVKGLRRRLRATSSALASGQGLVDRIIAATSEPVEVPVLKVGKQDQQLPRRSAVLPIFDQQYGQQVRRDDTPGGVGYFNREVFDGRVERYFSAVTRSLRDYAASHFIEELVICMGGDHVEGANIFRGQEWQLEIDPGRQVLELTVKNAHLLDRLIRFAKELGIERIRVYCWPGNHGKVGGKQAGATPTSFSFDVLHQEWLRDKLRGLPIDEFVVEPGGQLLFEAQGFTFLGMHGDEIRGWAGIPFYGISKFDGAAMRLHQAIFDYCLLGHHHLQSNTPNGGGEYLMSGDWVGANNLSREHPRAGRPRQRLLFVGESYGVTEDIPIYLSKADEARKQTHVYS